MTFKREQEIKIDGKDFYIIDAINYNNNQYIYVQQIENDELIDIYMVYKYDSERNAMIHIKEPELLDTLLKLFAENINKTLKETANNN